jgi:hypothetical protein
MHADELADGEVVLCTGRSSATRRQKIAVVASLLVVSAGAVAQTLLPFGSGIPSVLVWFVGILLFLPFMFRRSLTVGHYMVTDRRVIVRFPRLPVRRAEWLADLADPVLLTRADGPAISFGDPTRFQLAGHRPNGAPIAALVLRSVPDAERVLELIREAQRDARAGG